MFSPRASRSSLQKRALPMSPSVARPAVMQEKVALVTILAKDKCTTPYVPIVASLVRFRSSRATIALFIAATVSEDNKPINQVRPFGGVFFSLHHPYIGSAFLPLIITISGGKDCDCILSLRFGRMVLKILCNLHCEVRYEKTMEVIVDFSILERCLDAYV